jgi:hypothetical protein
MINVRENRLLGLYRIRVYIHLCPYDLLCRVFDEWILADLE